MEMIWGAIKTIYGYFSILPIIPFAIILFGYGAYIQDRKKAFRMAMDVTTIFLILAVAGLFNLLFKVQFGFYGILLFMVLGGGLLGNAQFRKRGSVDAKRIFRTIWRLSFFTMCLLYIVFMCIGIGKTILVA